MKNLLTFITIILTSFLVTEGLALGQGDPADNRPEEPAANFAKDSTMEVPPPEGNSAPSATDSPTDSQEGKDGELNHIDVLDLSQMDEAPEEKVSESANEEGATPEEEPEDITATLHIEEIVEPPSDFHYAAFGKSNPFESPDLTIHVEKKKEEVDRGLEIPIVSPLQEYAITDLQTKGIWQLENKEWRAIIMTPKSEGIIVKLGDPISAGKVMSIDRQKVTSRQYQIKADGAREFVDHELYLSPNKKSGKILLQPGKAPVFPTLNAPAPNPSINNPTLKAFPSLQGLSPTNQGAESKSLPSSEPEPQPAKAGESVISPSTPPK